MLDRFEVEVDVKDAKGEKLKASFGGQDVATNLGKLLNRLAMLYSLARGESQVYAELPSWEKNVGVRLWEGGSRWRLKVKPARVLLIPRGFKARTELADYKKPAWKEDERVRVYG